MILKTNRTLYKIFIDKKSIALLILQITRKSFTKEKSFELEFLYTFHCFGLHLSKEKKKNLQNKESDTLSILCPRF